jgi:hypothetical protein
MTNVLERAIACNDADDAAEMIRNALGIESDEAGLVGGEGFAVDASLIVAVPTSSARSRAPNGRRHALLRPRAAPRGSIWRPLTMRHSVRRAM